MALLTNRQLIIIVFAIMPESCTNTGADTLHISHITKNEHACVKHTPDHPIYIYISYTIDNVPKTGL